jgi:hypothetical protein
MKKLKLEKIKLSELTLNDQKNIVGGTNPTTTTISIASLMICTTTSVLASSPAATCLTNHPGTQDSCGLCTTNYKCPLPPIPGLQIPGLQIPGLQIINNNFVI